MHLSVSLSLIFRHIRFFFQKNKNHSQWDLEPKFLLDTLPRSNFLPSLFTAVTPIVSRKRIFSDMAIYDYFLFDKDRCLILNAFLSKRPVGCGLEGDWGKHEQNLFWKQTAGK